MGNFPSKLTVRDVRRAALKNIFAVSVAGVCLWLVVRQLDDLNISEIAVSFGAVTSAQWIIALIATALSFAAVGQYDVLFHRWLGTGIRPKSALLSGTAAIAVAQTLGFGLATGTIARWRALPELSIGTALKLTNYVSFSFMVALGLLSALAVTALGLEGTGTALTAGLAVLAFAVTVALSLIQPRWLPVPLPPLRLIGRLTLLAAVDTGLAALAMWVLLPAGVHPPFLLFFAAFLFALGAGLLSGAPGGVGPFELCLIAILPMVPESDLIAAVLAFRLVYYALPACLALCALARPMKDASDAPLPVVRSLSPQRAEAGLARQSGQLLRTSAGSLHVLHGTQSLVALGDPPSGGIMRETQLEWLKENANLKGLWPVLYKCSANSAVIARRSGWHVMPVSDEAWLNPQHFSTAGAHRRQLRRKLKKADKNSVGIEHVCSLPIAQMTRIAEQWAARCGGERGFSMGRFEPSYLEEQRCYLAYVNQRVVGFATFHIAANEWVLDLMRSADGVPDGTMHALIMKAIQDAAAAGVARLSLAAMPLESPPKLLRGLSNRPEAQGLRRFKLSFAPQTGRLYMAAPNRTVLAIAGADIVMRIARPAPISSTETVLGPDDLDAEMQITTTAPIPVRWTMQ